MIGVEHAATNPAVTSRTGSSCLSYLLISCDAGLKKITGDVEARHAPYREHLKADKLRLAIDERHGGVTSYALAGGKYTSDAKLLAAAKVWFLDIGPPGNERQNCPGGGKRNSVRRYSFDAQHAHWYDAKGILW